MATPIVNIFTQFLLTDIEEKSGYTFNQTQLMVLQNLRAEYAQQKVQLRFDPNNQQEYLQQEAEAHGWINCISYLLQMHEDNNKPEDTSSNEDTPKSGNDYGVFDQ